MSPEPVAVEQARRMSVDIIRRHLPDRAYRIFLFGSRASGTAHARSDIDIGIEGPTPVPSDTLASILEDIEESPTLYSVDVVDFRRLPDAFRAVASRHIAEIE